MSVKSTNQFSFTRGTKDIPRSQAKITALMIALMYYGVANAVGAALVSVDKFQAVRGARRVPEAWLHASGLSGGFIGGILAMRACRHKTQKTSFQLKYGFASSLNIATVCAVVLL